MSADLHSLLPAYERFADMLKGHDLGILAGDLLDPFIPPDVLMKMLDLGPDDFLEELPPEEETAQALFDRIMDQQNASRHPGSPLMRGLMIKEQMIKEILKTAGKPVLIVPGNHDETPWESDGLVVNIHSKKMHILGKDFVGYGCVDQGLNSENQMKSLHLIEPLVDHRTILITHIPPYGILDESTSYDVPLAIGSKKLLKLVTEKKPRLHVFGHVHEHFGRQKTFINASFPLRERFASVRIASSWLTSVRFLRVGVDHRNALSSLRERHGAWQ